MSDLQTDIYLRPGKRTRNRGFKRINCGPNGYEVAKSQSFMQSKHDNVLFGGLERNLPQLTTEFVESDTVNRMIKHVLMTELRGLVEEAEVNIHLHRSIATGVDSSEITPEGEHKDGVDWIFMMLIAGRAPKMPASRIRRNDSQTLHEITLNRPGDYILLHDKKYWHSVEQLESNGGTASREMLFMEVKVK